MLKGKVIGNIVSTNKLDKLIGYKFLEIQVIEKNELTDKFIVAVDRTVSAGIGEEVLVTTGSSARVAVGDETSPVDAVVVGVVDKKQN
jgi:ethanolamine utilization protein EutN